MGAIATQGFVLCLSGTLLCSLMGYLGQYSWLFDLAAHFKVQYLFIAITALFYFSLKRRRQTLFISVSLLCIAINLAEIIPWYLPSPAPASSTRPLQVLSINVQAENTNYAAVIDQVKEVQPDIAIFQEVTPAWSAALASLDATLPYHLSEPRNTYFGIALYSAIPLENATTKTFGRPQVESLVADITLADSTPSQPAGHNTISVIATHPPPPHRPSLFAARNQHFSAMGQYIQTLSHPVIVVGDLNITPWSPIYRQFIRLTGLKNSRQGFGILPTWPTLLPLMYIPIDHCLVSPDIRVLETQVGEPIDSDHLPIVVQLAL